MLVGVFPNTSYLKDGTVVRKINWPGKFGCIGTSKDYSLVHHNNITCSMLVDIINKATPSRSKDITIELH